MELDAVAPENAEAGRPLTRALMRSHLSVLGRNPFTLAHIYTTATLDELQLSDLEAIREFPHLQHIRCSGNQLRSLAPLADVRLVLSLDASRNELIEALGLWFVLPPTDWRVVVSHYLSMADFEVPKCTPTTAWADGQHWIGSLLRRADLSHNRIPRVRELGQAHPFLLELHLAHNEIKEITGVSRLRFLRVLDLSHNRLTSTRGLVDDTVKDHSRALETLLLGHNAISSVDEVAALPRLERLDLAHNQMVHLTSIGACHRLQHLDLTSNEIENVNELNHLMGLVYLQTLSLLNCPLVQREDSHLFYRARVLRRLCQLKHLDRDAISAKEKVKAMVMHGSDLVSRQQVFAKYLPSKQFINFLSPLEFDDDQELFRVLESKESKRELDSRQSGTHVANPNPSTESVT